MALIDKIFGRNKTLTDLDKTELAAGGDSSLRSSRERLFKKIEDVANTKQKIFQQGAKQKSPELRKALAQDFELKTQEQILAAKELGSLRSKELLTVSRLRMIKENQGRGKALGRLNLTDKDVVKMQQWIEDDAVTQDAYQERLDMLLETGSAADKESSDRQALSTSGQEPMDMWSKLDRGAVKEDEAFEKARTKR